VALVRRFLAAPDERAAIAAAGRAHALEHHTYAHRLARLLEGRGHTMV
jgi:spore maturation protein CgeB